MMAKIPHIRTVAPSRLRSSSYAKASIFGVSENRAAVQLQTEIRSSAQCTLRNEYTPEGIPTPEAVGLQKCNVTVSAALA